MYAVTNATGMFFYLSQGDRLLKKKVSRLEMLQTSLA